jgi:predicted ribosome quality control (RQC) complex YloA/Tae2 family protein
LFPAGEIEASFSDPLEAAQAFARIIGYRFYLENAKREAATTLAKRREQTVLYLEKMRVRRKALEEGRSPQEIADLVLAQMHQFAKTTQGQTVTLDDYYRGGQFEIKLKEGQTPQVYAEQLYRKAKNAGQELRHLEEQEAARLAWLEKLEVAAKEIEAMDDVRAIRKTLAAMGPTLVAKADEETLPYRAVYIRGWEVKIGKNAQANDEMLRAHSHKDDLWLHAKDVAGSHVIITRQAGQAFPKDIVEAAAALAAYHSKKRTESLADVMVTERKNVRKVKGTPAGSVRVQKERVLLVPPADKG